jgi:hypothetical protein
MTPGSRTWGLKPLIPRIQLFCQLFTKSLIYILKQHQHHALPATWVEHMHAKLMRHWCFPYVQQYVKIHLTHINIKIIVKILVYGRKWFQLFLSVRTLLTFF